MSAHSRTTVVQSEVTVPHVSDLNPKNSTEPLAQVVFTKHEIPSNEVINVAIDHAKNTLNESTADGRLNSKGEKLVHDTTDILDSMQKLINERNADNKLQDLVHHSKTANEEFSRQAGKVAHSVQTEAKYTAKELKHTLPGKSSLAKGGITISGPFGTLGSLSNITSLMSNSGFKFPHSKELEGEAKDIYNFGKELFSYAIRSNEFREFVDDLIEFLKESVDQATDKLSGIADAAIDDFENADLALNSTAKELRNAGKETRKMLISKEQWSEEKVHEYYGKFVKLLKRVSERPEYQKILDLFWKWIDEAIDMGQQAKEIMKDKAEQVKDDALTKVEKVHDKAVTKTEKFESRAERNANRAKRTFHRSVAHATPIFNLVWSDIAAIVDGFAGENAFENFYEKLSELYVALYDDSKASEYFKSLKSFINEAVNNPMILQDKEKMEEGKSILVRGREVFISGDYSQSLREVIDQFKAILNSIRNDPLTNDLMLKVRQFGEDFALDEQGRPDIFIIQDSLASMKDILYPILTKKLASMTIDRVAGQTDKVNWQLENVIISLPTLLPESFQLRTKNLLDVNFKELHTKKNVTKVILEIKEIKPAFHNIKFWYKLKTFPHLEDRGIVDVDLAGEGARIKVEWKIQSKENTPFAFSLMRVNCDIDKLNIGLRAAKHDVLDKMVIPFIQGQIKQQVAQGIVNAIVDAVQPLNDTLNGFFSKRPIEHLKERIQERIHTQMEKTNVYIQSHPLQNSIEAAKDKVEELKERMDARMDYTKDRITDGVEDTRDAVKDKAEVVQKRVTDLKGAVQDKLGMNEYTMKEDDEEYTFSEQSPKRTMKSDLNAKYEEVKQNMYNKVDSLAGRGLETADEIKEKGEQKYSQFKEERLPEIKEKLVEFRDKLPEKAEEYVNKGVDKFDDNRNRLPEKVDEIKEKGEERYNIIKDNYLPKSVAKKSDEVREMAQEKAEELHEQAVKQLRETKEKMPKDSDDWKDLAEDVREKGSELKDKVPTTKKEFKKAVNNAEDDIKDKVHEVKSDAKWKALEKLPEALDEASEIKDKVVDAIPKNKEEVKETYQAVKEELPDWYRERLEITEKVATDLKERGEDKYEQAKDKASDLKEKGEEKFEEIKEKGQEKLEEAKDKASELKQKGEEKVEQVKEQAKDKASELKQKGEEKVEQAKDKASELKQKGEEKVEQAKDKASELKQKGEEKVEQAKDKASELKQKGEEKVEQAKDKASELKQKGEEKLDEAKDKASELKEKGEEKLDEAKDKASELKEKGEEKMEKAKDKASDLKEKGEEKVDQVKEKVDQKSSSSSEKETRTERSEDKAVDLKDLEVQSETVTKTTTVTATVTKTEEIDLNRPFSLGVDAKDQFGWEAQWKLNTNPTEQNMGFDSKGRLVEKMKYEDTINKAIESHGNQSNQPKSSN